MSVRRFIRVTGIRGIALLLGASVIVAGALPLRYSLLSLLYDPKNLPAAESDARVHFEVGAKACAAEVAALLPAAIARVETIQGRPFARSPTIGVYASPELFASANGFGHPNVAGASQWGRVTLSPRLCAQERTRLAAVLTHELSHAHLLGWRSSLFLTRPPSWFTEGLAVMASEGGGAEGVSEKIAAHAILRGYAIAIGNQARWIAFDAIPFAIEPLGLSIPRQRLAYRQAAMFVAWLRARDEGAFARLLAEIESGGTFSAAFLASYGADPLDQWRRFVSALAQG
jgi:hypothetical protein